jgi:hypothetical protein
MTWHKLLANIHPLVSVWEWALVEPIVHTHLPVAHIYSYCLQSLTQNAFVR